MTLLIEVEVNCPDIETARAIGRAAVEGGLAACANVIAGVESVYLWEGRVESDPEVALWLKSRMAVYDRLCALIGRMHPYDLPSIVAPVLAANPGYADWLDEGTQG